MPPRTVSLDIESGPAGTPTTVGIGGSTSKSPGEAVGKTDIIIPAKGVLMIGILAGLVGVADA